MRKQPRSTASFAMLMLTATLVATTSMLFPEPALAHGTHRRAKAVAPPTAANFERLRSCESSGDYSAVNPSNRYFGAYQFSVTTWQSLGYGGLPHLAPPEVQDEAAQRLQAKAGWRQWPGCSRRLRLR
ncbi:MAG TPA: transglycosylase family protein [Acidimicrobiales bacterium]|nr:transglycosylase family protein [Acidimicrobiales bacterium]